MNLLRLITNIHGSKLISYVEVLTSVEKILVMLSKLAESADYIKSYILLLLEKILNFKTFILNIIKIHITFYFKEDRLSLVKNWLINHSLIFKTKNMYTNINEDKFITYRKTKNIQELLIIEPQVRGIIHIKNTKVEYILNKDSISLFHINRTILNDVLKDLIDYLDNKIPTGNEKYKPKIFKYKIETIDNNKEYSWELENTIFEDIKIFFKKEDKERLLIPFENFYNNKELYNQIGLCYKIVSCFLGKPGMGKTTVVKYLAQKYSKDIYVFSDLSMPVEVFLSLYKNIPQNSIILFDDFDKITTYLYTYVTPILNILDGVLTKHGSAIIFCLNNGSFLERNFPTITRVGRIDNYQDFNTFDQCIAEEVVREIYTSYTENEIKEYIYLISKEKKVPQISELKNRCLMASGKLYKAIKILNEKLKCEELEEENLEE